MAYEMNQRKSKHNKQRERESLKFRKSFNKQFIIITIMKKYYFILAAAALALASCSSDETIESAATSPSNEISFRAFANNATRATDIDASTMQTSGFTVFATVGSNFSTIYFNETAFTYSGGTYTSATKYYWPSSGTLDFYAYAHNGAANQVTHTAQTKAFTVTPDATAANQTDLVFANTNGKSKTGKYADNTKEYGANGVPLNFRHAESKITVQLRNTSTSLKVTVKDVAIGYLNTVGTYTYSGSTTSTDTDHASEYLKFADWTAKSGTGSYTQTASTTSYTSATAITALPQSFILIPQELTTATAYSAATADAAFNGAFITVELKIQNALNDVYIVGNADTYVTALWPLPTGTWNPGYHYTYTVDLAGGGYYPTNQTSIGTGTDLDPILDGAEIKFVDVTVDSWTDGGNTNVGM